MKTLINKILEIFNTENVSVLDISVGFQCENKIRISVENKDKFFKWSYFADRVKRCNIAELNIDYPVITFLFYDKTVESNLEIFYKLLCKKYYLVCPSVKKLNLLTKPTCQCNFDCKYCYDKPFRESLKNNMTFNDLDKLLQLVSNYAEDIQFIWHGGEPTLMGIDWFDQAYEKVISKYPMCNFQFSIMSNGSNYNDQYLEMFKRHNISCGSSFNAFHQKYLRSQANTSEGISLEDNLNDSVFKNILNYNLKGQRTGVIDVISSANYKHQIEIYEFYKKYDIGVCMNHIFHTSQTEKNGLELEFDDYAREFKKYFKHWLYDLNGVHERSAMNILKIVIGSRDLTCGNTDCRYKWLGIAPNGDIYPCDRYYPEKYRIGNVHQYDSIQEVFASKGYQTYSNEVQKRFDTHCKECGYLSLCGGGCNASAIESSGSAEGVEEFYCKLFREKIKIVYEEIRNLDLLNNNLNPYAKDFLVQNNFYSIKDIKRYISNSGKDIELKYDKTDILNCNEYKVFRGINPIRYCENDYIMKHVDHLVYNLDKTQEEINEENEEIRKTKFFETLKSISDKALHKEELR